MLMSHTDAQYRSEEIAPAHFTLFFSCCLWEFRPTIIIGSGIQGPKGILGQLGPFCEFFEQLLTGIQLKGFISDHKKKDFNSILKFVRVIGIFLSEKKFSQNLKKNSTYILKLKNAEAQSNVMLQFFCKHPHFNFRIGFCNIAKKL